MSAGLFTLYTTAKLALLQGQIDLAAVKLQVVLLTGSYVPSAAHATYADVSNNEVSGAAGTGYTTGGEALTGQGVTASVGAVAFTANANSWPNATFAVQYVALIEMAGATPGPADKLLGFAPLSIPGPISVAEGTFNLSWPSAGIISL